MMEEFFLENQEDLDALDPPPPPPAPTPECEHEWYDVFIGYTGIPGFLCCRCGAEKFAQRMDPEDFAGRNYNHFSRRRRRPREPQPQCTIKTVRGSQCMHPCHPGKDQCTRHLNHPPRSPQPLCHTKMKKGIECKHPCRPGEDRCGRHQTLRGVRSNA